MRVGIWFWSLVLVIVFGCERDPRDPSPATIPFLSEEASLAEDLLQQMSPTEKAGQLFVLRSGPDQAEALIGLVAQGAVGGLLLEDWPAGAFLAVTDSCRGLSRIPLLVGTREQVLLNNQFEGTRPFPSPGSMQAVGDDSLRSSVARLFQQQLRAFGINWVLGPEATVRGPASDLGWQAYYQTVAELNQHRVLSTAWKLTVLPADTIGTDHLLSGLLQPGASALFIDPELIVRNAEPLGPDWLSERLGKVWGFRGLLVSELKAGQDPLPLLRAGVDLLITKDATIPVARVEEYLQQKKMRAEQLDNKVRKILRAKNWMREGFAPPVYNREVPPLQASLAGMSLENARARQPLPDSLLVAGLAPERWDYLTYKLYEESVTLVHNHDQLLPFGALNGRRFRLLQYSSRPFSDFRKYFERYADVQTILQPPAEDGTLPPVKERESGNWVHLVLLESGQVRWERDLPFVQSLRALARREPVVLVNFGDPANLEHFDTTITAIQVYERNEVTEATAAQLLFGALQAKGRLPATVNEYFPIGGSVETPVWRLKYGRPEEVGIAPERLVGIDAIARTAIEDRATPGCQVVVAKDGKIIYHKAFGWHDYQKNRPVRETDLYDIASITKVAATTLAAMSLYEQKKLDLNDHLEEAVGMPSASALRRISLRKLLIHQSGLQPHMPTLSYLRFRDQPNAECDSFFCKNGVFPYTVKVADNFFFDQRYQDSIWSAVWGLEVSGNHRYRYSDVNFVLLQRIMEERSGLPLDQFVNRQVYQPMGLRRTLFRPLDYFPRGGIVPTQQDDRWRQQLVHGFVHDETAAMLGGVAGNAGLFSTAEELAVIFQMLLNGGTYGGQRFFDPKTIQLFTAAQYGHHRGLGFDKPSVRYHKAMANDAPGSTFGHTGFTGTCVWADPDNGLVYVFLSNRIHPDVNNRILFKNRVRERIHQVVYDALGTYQEQQQEPVLKGG